MFLGVEGIPTLAIFDKNGKLLTDSGVEKVLIRKY